MPFVKGQSGNPSGRSKAYAAMSRRILDLSKNGDELVDFLFATMRDTKSELKMRVHCAELLLDRGLGKPREIVDVEPEMTAEEYAAECVEIARETIAAMTPADRARFLSDPAPAATIQ